MSPHKRYSPYPLPITRKSDDGLTTTRPLSHPPAGKDGPHQGHRFYARPQPDFYHRSHPPAHRGPLHDDEARVPQDRRHPHLVLQSQPPTHPYRHPQLENRGYHHCQVQSQAQAEFHSARSTTDTHIHTEAERIEGPKRAPKAYEPTRPTGRYQPSRGAQRDMRYSKKLADQLGLGGAASSASPPKSHTQTQAHQESRSDSQAHSERVLTSKSKRPHSSSEGYTTQSSRTQNLLQSGVVRQHSGDREKERERERELREQIQPQEPLKLNFDARLEMEKIRQEQMAAVQAARVDHQRVQAQAHEKARLKAQMQIRSERVKQEEDEKKVRRIQLHVFVHARPTHCEWDHCQAVLNSWALLEKHLNHAHLRSSPSSDCGGIDDRNDREGIDHQADEVRGSRGPRCRWQGCSVKFESSEECYRHALISHMGGFAARCPFNCLFQGTTFPSLMAHIARRHPVATPDDFVPGLIHYRPDPSLLSQLPSLPPLLSPSSSPAASHKIHWLNPIRPWTGGIGSRNKKTILRNCYKGRYPRVEAYEDKKGAEAAIQAIIENAKRLKKVEVPPGSAISICVKGEGKNESGELDLDMGDQQPGTARTVVELLDVLKSAKSASDEAAREIDEEDSSFRPPSVDGSNSESSGIRSLSIPASPDALVANTRRQKGPASSGSHSSQDAADDMQAIDERSGRDTPPGDRSEEGQMVTRRRLRLSIGGVDLNQSVNNSPVTVSSPSP